MKVWQYMISEFSFGVENSVCEMAIKDLTEERIKAIPGCAVLRKCFLRMYQVFPKLETLPEEEKKELKKYVIEMFPGRGVDELVENCKVVYTIGKLIK